MTGALIGEPLLGISAIDPVAGTFEVEQVQVGRLLAGGDVYRPFDVFTDVPFAVGCMLADPVTGDWIYGPSGLSGCDGHLVYDGPSSVPAPDFAGRQLSSTQTVVVGDGVGWPSLPEQPHFVYGLFANDLLLGEATDRYAVGMGLTTAPPSYLDDPRPVTWRPYCADGDTESFCTGDYDNDGVPDDLHTDEEGNTDGLPDDLDGDGALRPYDCYDDSLQSASVYAYPLAVEPVVDWPPDYADPHTVKDFNCDGWPVDWTQRPGGN